MASPCGSWLRGCWTGEEACGCRVPEDRKETGSLLRLTCQRWLRAAEQAEVLSAAVVPVAGLAEVLAVGAG